MLTATDGLLMASALTLGVGGSVHCAAMCGPLCAALAPRPGSDSPVSGATQGLALTPWLAGRVAGYAAAGAAIAGGLGWLTSGGPVLDGLRWAWALAHAAVLALGLWLLIRGRQPSWMDIGRSDTAIVRVWRTAPSAGGVPLPALRAGSLGAAWVFLPCGLLQSALVVAALGSSAAAGGMVMATFALASAPGLLAGPVLLGALARRHPRLGDPRFVVRASGALCVLAAGWALGHGLWRQVQAYC